MSSGIYGFFDIEGECLYVGQSSDMEGRKRQHLKYLRGGYHKREEFNKWFADNGEDGLVFKVLELCPDDTNAKNALEIEYFNRLEPRFFGQIPSRANRFTHSEVTRQRISRTVRENLEQLGVYQTRQCFCGKSFSVPLSATNKNCSRTCANSSLEAGLDYDTIVQMYSAGQTLAAMGAKLGVSYRTVHSFMVRNNIPRRRGGPTPKL